MWGSQSHPHRFEKSVQSRTITSRRSPPSPIRYDSQNTDDAGLSCHWSTSRTFRAVRWLSQSQTECSLRTEVCSQYTGASPCRESCGVPLDGDAEAASHSCVTAARAPVRRQGGESRDEGSGAQGTKPYWGHQNCGRIRHPRIWTCSKCR